MPIKKLLGVLCLCAWLQPGFTQAAHADWDSSFRPAGYALKVGLFESYPNSRHDIIFLGNSITAGADWNELLGLTRARNRGISGDITFGVLQRLDEVIRRHPAKVFVLVGINDISRNIPDSVILDNYTKIIRRIRSGSRGTKIYFQTLMPVNGTFDKFKNHYNKDEHIAAVNEGLKAIGNREHIPVIDIHPLFLDDRGRLRKELTSDGLHPNAAGYLVWKSALLPYVK